MRLHLPRRRSVAVTAAGALLCVLAGCGTTSTPTQTSPAPAATAASTTAVSPTADVPSAACADLEELRSSLDALANVDVAQNGVAALDTAMANVRTNLMAVETSGSEAFQPQVEQVKIALGNVQTARAGLTPDNRKEKAPGIAAALKDVRTATTELSSTITETCPKK